MAYRQTKIGINKDINKRREMIQKRRKNERKEEGKM
jgi:hypothetical protein